MSSATWILMGILMGMGAVALLMLIAQLFKLKIWVFEKSKHGGNRFSRIGFLNVVSDSEVPEVHLTDSAKGPAIGRLPMNEKDGNAYVELLVTDPDDDSEKSRYHTYGFVSPDGWIYKSNGKSKRAQKIGYLARPSDPNTPTSEGERSWKSLWLKKKLYAFSGFPEVQPVEEEPQPTVPVPEETNPEETQEQELLPEETSQNPEDDDEGGGEIDEETLLDESENDSLEVPHEETPEPIKEESPEPVKEDASEEVIEESSEAKEEEKNDENTPVNGINQFRQVHKKAPKKAKKEKAITIRMPEAEASFTGLRSTSKDIIPAEAKAAAFGLFYRQYNKRNFQEHYASPAYGWKDTALLAGFIYSVLYVIWYIFNVKLLDVRFLGYKFWQDIPLYFAFYAIWVIVRAIKIECIERSDTIQPKIDLFNKTVGQKGYDILILICCAFTLAFSGRYYRYDFIPLAAVIITAICINWSLKSSQKPWKTENPLNTEDEEEEDEVENPPGDIERIYEWELDSPEVPDVKGDLALYFDAKYINDLRFFNPFFNQRKDKTTGALVKEMFQYLKRHRSVSARSRYIVKRIQEISRQKGLTELDTLQFTLDFVQEPNIRFVLNRDSDSILKFEDYIRYPDEVLYDKEADSNSKAFLAAVLVHYLKRNVLFLYSRLQQHGAIGIEVDRSWDLTSPFFTKPIEEMTFMHKGKQYLFCETTADGFRLGGTMGGMRPQDFDERVDLPVIEPENEEDNEESDTRIYNWDLDSETGATLHGQYTLEFAVDELEDLRQHNPFINYGKDGKTYEQNVRWMFNYLEEEPQRKSNIREIAQYIKREAKSAGLSELDTVQFALDFCQAPNITYKIDEECESIPYNEVTKEYMRFPDEVLYDQEGDCDCKSSLTIAMFKEMGYKTLFMMSEKYKHAAVGVEYNPEWKDLIKIEDESAVIREVNGVKYIYCETTGDGYRVGHIKEGDTIQEFDTVVEI